MFSTDNFLSAIIPPYISLKFQTCYITGQWGGLTVKIRMLIYTDIHILSWHFFFIKYLHFYHFHFFFWRSIKFLQQNINHSSETGNIQVIRNCQSNCVNGLFQKKNIQGGSGHGISRGIEKIKCGNSRGEEKEFTGVIKKKSCEISPSLGYRPWNFQGV